LINLIYRGESLSTLAIWEGWEVSRVGNSQGAILTNKERLSYVLTQKEEKILSDIKEKLKLGNVSYDKAANCWRYRIGSKYELKLLTELFNGNLILLKRKEQLKGWLNIYNIKSIEKEILPTLNDGWLSGFIDAEGCFNLTTNKKSVRLRYMIDQKDSKDTMLYLAKLLEININDRRLRGVIDVMHRITTSKLDKIQIIINYLNKFPLKTKKKKH